MMDAEPLLSVRNLRTQFVSQEGTTKAVDGVSFDIYQGRTLGIVGETGCGKSVTARSILRLEKPGKIVSGEIVLRRGTQQLNLTELPPNGPVLRSVRGGDIGLVFQEPMSSFSPVHTVGNQLIEAVRLHNDLPKAEARARAVELLDLAGVPRPSERLSVYPWQLSGGLLQRAMIAVALAGGPRLLIADEPTTALDVIIQAQILDLFRELQERTGMGLMLITHDLGVVAQMADDVVVMYLGRVVEKGPVDEIFHAPRHPYTQALLASMPSRHRSSRIKLPTITGSIPHPFDRPTGCPFHPRCQSVILGQCDVIEPARRIVSAQYEVSCHLEDVQANGNGHRSSVQLVMRTEEVAVHRDGEILLDVRHLRKSFPQRHGILGRKGLQVHAVDDVSFSVREGETLALVGESGSGKTTTSRCVLRALAPDSGEILFQSSSGARLDLAKLSTKQLRPLRRDIQMIFQDPYSSLNPRMTVLDIVSEPLLVNDVTSRQVRVDRVEELLGLVGLRPEYMQRYPHAFSGGQRQRIGIARALALHPRLVVADEPVSALDVSVQAQTLNLLTDIQERLKLTYLFVSHDLSVVRHISDRVGVMYAGELVEMGETQKVLDEPKHPYTAALLAAIAIPDPRARKAFTGASARVPTTSPPEHGCQFQPRCPYAIDICVTERPALEEVTPGRPVRCHRAAELELATTALVLDAEPPGR